MALYAIEHEIDAYLDRQEESEEQAERIDAKVAEFRADPEKVKEADEWMYGSLSCEHYSALESAAADLADVPADRLVGSDALARMLRLCNAQRDERMKHLSELAEGAIRDEDMQAAMDAAEAAADRRAAA